MGREEIKQLLGQTLDEEKQADSLLTEVSSAVNGEALAANDEEDEEASASKKSASKTAKSKTKK